MSNERKNKALARISAALSRIEQIAQSPLPVNSDGEKASEELAALTERHSKLKEEATIALSALDAVIARASAGGRA